MLFYQVYSYSYSYSYYFFSSSSYFKLLTQKYFYFFFLLPPFLSLLASLGLHSLDVDTFGKLPTAFPRPKEPDVPFFIAIPDLLVPGFFICLVGFVLIFSSFSLSLFFFCSFFCFLFPFSFLTPPFSHSLSSPPPPPSSFVEAMAVSKQFCIDNAYHVSPNRELVAFGLMNVMGGTFSFFFSFSFLLFPPPFLPPFFFLPRTLPSFSCDCFYASFKN